MLKVYKYEEKTIEQAKKKAVDNLLVTEEKIFFRTKEVSGGLFKGKKVELEAILLSDLIDYIKENIKKIVEMMNIEINMEVKNREGNISFLIYSNNNPILIGKNGKTIESLQMIIKQAIYSETGIYFNFIIDVGDYKIKQQHNIEYLAEKTANEVAKTKMEARMDNMNSYERRIVHSVLSENKSVYTESVGEEPNRYVIIKPKGE
jgi:spoIIIJ-associated protein